jgi:hypothetical protein
MTLWLILLLIWLGGIPAGLLVTAAVGSRWYQHRLHRASRAYRKTAALLMLDPRCGRRMHHEQMHTWTSERRYRRAGSRRPV